ncbi:MAG TPA: DUF6614 family protein [Myxococcota bacterium]|nr:DUF6614 family protein [Myxococcota bacterium]
MDVYHVWCDLKPGTSDLDFARDVGTYLSSLKERGHIAGFRLTRRKLGLGPRELGEFHIAIELRDLAQLDGAFGEVAARREPLESFHAAVNQAVRGAQFALYRDFPDPQRERGADKS